MKERGIQLKLGLCSITLRQKSPEEIADLVKEAKLDAIEWGGDVHVPPGDNGNAEYVASLTKSKGLEISSYGSYYRIAEPEHNNHDFETILKTAKHLGAPAIRVWAGKRGSDKADQAYREKVAAEARRTGDLAAKDNISIHLEYHGNTLTDTKESAKALMESISHENVFLYWQPSNFVSVEERLKSIDFVGKWITNIHIFHWHSFKDRMSLEEGFEDWKGYLEKVQQDNKDRYVLMEFVKNDDPQQFLEDARILRKLREEVKV